MASLRVIDGVGVDCRFPMVDANDDDLFESEAEREKRPHRARCRTAGAAEKVSNKDLTRHSAKPSARTAGQPRLPLSELRDLES
jgi:hypothetical protein